MTMSATPFLFIVLASLFAHTLSQDNNAIVVNNELSMGFQIRSIVASSLLQICGTAPFDDIRPFSMSYLPSTHTLFIKTNNRLYQVDPHTCVVKSSCALSPDLLYIAVDKATGLLYAMSQLGFVALVDPTDCSFCHFCEVDFTNVGGLSTGIEIIGDMLYVNGPTGIAMAPLTGPTACTITQIVTYPVPNINGDITALSDTQIIGYSFSSNEYFTLDIPTSTITQLTTSLPLRGGGITSLFFDPSSPPDDTTMPPVAPIMPSPPPTTAPQGGVIDTLITAKGASMPGFDYRLISDTNTILGSCDIPELETVPFALAYSAVLDRVLYINRDQVLYSIDPYTCQIEKICIIGTSVAGLMVDKESGRIFGEGFGNLVYEVDLETCKFSVACDDAANSGFSGEIVDGVLYVGVVVLQVRPNFLSGSCETQRIINTGGSCVIDGLTAISANTLIAACRDGSYLSIDINTDVVTTLVINAPTSGGLASFHFNPPPPPAFVGRERCIRRLSQSSP